jgi:hypothetical protein
MEIGQRRWRWIGHTLRNPAINTTKQGLRWNPQGKRKRGRPRNTWRSDLGKDVKKTGRTWAQLGSLAQDREGWRKLIGGLCPVEGDRYKVKKEKKKELMINANLLTEEESLPILTP